MLIEFAPNHQTYEFTGVSVYPINFRFYDLTSIEVYTLANPDDPARPDRRDFEYGVDYTVTGNQAEKFGSEVAYISGQVTLTASGLGKIARGWNLIILRETERAQNYAYIELDPFPADSHENALTKLTAIVQELYTLIQHAVKVPIGSNVTPEEYAQMIFDAADRACACADQACECAQIACECASRAEAAQKAAEAARDAAIRAQKAAEAARDRAEDAATYAEQQANRAKQEADRAQAIADSLRGEWAAFKEEIYNYINEVNTDLNEFLQQLKDMQLAINQMMQEIADFISYYSIVDLQGDVSTVNITLTSAEAIEIRPTGNVVIDIDQLEHKYMKVTTLIIEPEAECTLTWYFISGIIWSNFNQINSLLPDQSAIFNIWQVGGVALVQTIRMSEYIPEPGVETAFILNGSKNGGNFYYGNDPAGLNVTGVGVGFNMTSMARSPWTGTFVLTSSARTFLHANTLEELESFTPLSFNGGYAGPSPVEWFDEDNFVILNRTGSGTAVAGYGFWGTTEDFSLTRINMPINSGITFNLYQNLTCFKRVTKGEILIGGSAVATTTNYSMRVKRIAQVQGSGDQTLVNTGRGPGDSAKTGYLIDAMKLSSGAYVFIINGATYATRDTDTGGMVYVPSMPPIVEQQNNDTGTSCTIIPNGLGWCFINELPGGTYLMGGVGKIAIGTFTGANLDGFTIYTDGFEGHVWVASEVSAAGTLMLVASDGYVAEAINGIDFTFTQAIPDISQLGNTNLNYIALALNPRYMPL